MDSGETRPADHLGLDHSGQNMPNLCDQTVLGKRLSHENGPNGSLNTSFSELVQAQHARQYRHRDGDFDNQGGMTNFLDTTQNKRMRRIEPTHKPGTLNSSFFSEGYPQQSLNESVDLQFPNNVQNLSSLGLTFNNASVPDDCSKNMLGTTNARIV